MTSVYTVTLSNQLAYMDHLYSRYANNAGLALPHIPRRTSSSRSPARTPSTTLPPKSSPLSTTSFPDAPHATPTQVVVQPPTPPDARQVAPTPAAASSSSHSGTSSGSGSDTYVEILAPKARRARAHLRGGLTGLMIPPEQSTPTPATLKSRGEKLASRVPFPIDDEDSTPRASASSLVLKPRPSPPRAITDHVLHPRSVSVSVANVGRKKSGEPLKSSLKSRRPVVRGDLSVVTGLSSTKSEPSTPTHMKSVHFDKQLEHVKLFLAEQKPLAVSRDGSPTDDTSGTDSDFPAFIYGDDKEDKKRQLEMTVLGLKAETAEEREKADVKLESLRLGEDGLSLVGMVRVRNIAFEKWVVVRFTCDWWQTTSEVSARYVESVPGGIFDRFQFTVRLNDMIGRIEEKTMFLAVKYFTAGKEMWDNNNQQNYRATFSWKKASAKKLDTMGRAGNIADLKSKLEKVANGDDEGKATVGGFLSSRTHASSSNSAAARDDDADEYDASFTLKSKTPLSPRYDLSASLKSSSRRSRFLADDTPTHGERTRTNTYPASLPNFSRRSSSDKRAYLALTRGSPRILDTDDADARSGIQSYYANSDLEDTHNTTAPAMSRKTSRNHQRGYFDLGFSPSGTGVRRTPPGTPLNATMMQNKEEQPRSVSPPASGSGFVRAASTIPVMSTSGSQIHATGRMWRVPSGGSEDSTPSSTSNEDSSRNSSPDRSPYEGPINLAPEDAFPRSPSPGDEASYSVFLNRFCFYTGSDSLLDVPSEIHRSHSASSVEEFLSTSPYLGGSYHLSPGQTPTRSSSYDDVATMSGSSTPTARSIAAGASTDKFEIAPAATPVALVN